MKISTQLKTTAFVVSCVLSSALLPSAAMANEQTEHEKQNELIGFGSGIAIGTAIAGPLGGMVAGVFGLLIADDINSDKKLAKAEATIRQKEQTLVSMQRQYEQDKQVTMVQIASLDKALEQAKPELESNIQFKTGSYTLQPHYTPQLDLVAETLVNNPSLFISLSGYADQRGDDTLNQALSEQRANAVKQYLLDRNVKSEQVLTNSYGETSLVSTGENYEDDFFDRRVHLKVAEQNSVMTAAN